MSSRSAQTRAGKLLTKFLRQIAHEETEFVVDADGQDKMATKAEALVRKMWDIALGYVERVEDRATGEVTEITYKPDRKMMEIIFERLDGKVASHEDQQKHKLSVADRVSEQSRNRINELNAPDPRN